MKTFSVFVEQRPDYRRLLNSIRKNSKLFPYMKSWRERSIVFECDTIEDATLLSALVKAALEKDSIAHQFEIDV